MSDFLQLESLTLAYGNTIAVDSLDLSVRQGELVAFLGPSGCGKSTTMRAIAGLMKTHSGTIRLDGRDITRVAPNKRDVGMVFQSYALFPHLSVAENVAFGLRLKRLEPDDIEQQVTQGLSMVGLEDFAARMPAELSGGQQQRVALARALVMDPKVLLLDEPLSNLDARLRLEMRAELQRVQKQTGLTMIFVTHDQVEALSLADRIVVMNKGCVEQIGTPEDIYNRPATSFVADFVGFENIFATDGLQLLSHLDTSGEQRLHGGSGGTPAQELAWRPANVSLGAGNYRGTVIGNAFAGPVREYLLDTPLGPVRADVSADQPAWQIGSDVSFDLPVNTAVPLNGYELNHELWNSNAMNHDNGNSNAMYTAPTVQLWVDTDMGFDDMHALLYLRQAGIIPVGQSLVYGCATLSQVHRNTRAFSAQFNWQTPWYSGAEKSLRGQIRTAKHVLGTQGFRTRGRVMPDAPPLPVNQPAVTAMIDWLSGSPDDAQILALGPLTNIARLCQQAPELISRIQRLTWMGGSLAHGNQTPYAEFNAWADAQAAAIVLSSGIPVRLVDLDVCREVQIFPEDVDRFATLKSDAGKIVHDLLGGYLDIGLSRNRGHMAIYDPVAAALLVSPDDFQMQPACIHVETEDAEREGQTLLQGPLHYGYPHEIVTMLSPDRVKARLLDALMETVKE